MDIYELYSILLSDDIIDKLQQKEDDLFNLIPELRTCKGFDQKNPWHIYDVYEHILHVTDNVPKNIVIRLAALFHDIGKPDTFTEDENGVGHFRGHWSTSLKIFLVFATRNRIDVNTMVTVSKLIYFHDVQIDENNKELFDTVISNFSISELEMLYELKRADLLAQNSIYHKYLESLKQQEQMVLKKIKNL